MMIEGQLEGKIYDERGEFDVPSCQIKVGKKTFKEFGDIWCKDLQHIAPIVEDGVIRDEEVEDFLDEVTDGDGGNVMINIRVGVVVTWVGSSSGL